MVQCNPNSCCFAGRREMSNGPLPALSPAEVLLYDAAVRRFKSGTAEHETLLQLVRRVPSPTLQSSTNGARRNGHHQRLSEHTRRLQQQTKLLDSIGGPGKNDKLDLQLTVERANAAFHFFQVYEINGLPNEILLNILRITANSSPSDRRNTLTRKALTHVCSRWRHLMLADTTQWTNLILVNTPPHVQSFTCMERAGDAMLNVIIDDTTRAKIDGGAFTPETFAAMIDRLFVKLPSIRSITATLLDWDSSHVLLEKLQDAALAGTKINLHKLDISRTGQPYIQFGNGLHDDDNHPPVPLFGGMACPTLKHFGISGGYIDWNNTTFTHLTTLSLGAMLFEASPDYERFQSMLAGCPNLGKLILNGAGPNLRTPPPPPYSGPRLENLKILVLSAFSVGYLSELIDSFFAPNLVDLTIANFGGEDYSRFFEAITGMFVELQILTLFNLDHVEGAEARRATAKWAMTIPRLRLLRVSNISVPFLDTFFDDPDSMFLTPAVPTPVEPIHTTRKVICPKLEILDASRLSPQALLRFLQARRALRAPIRKMYLPKEWQNPPLKTAVETLQLVVPCLLQGPQGHSVEEQEIHAENGMTGRLARAAD